MYHCNGIHTCTYQVASKELVVSSERVYLYEGLFRTSNVHYSTCDIKNMIFITYVVLYGEFRSWKKFGVYYSSDILHELFLIQY